MKIAICFYGLVGSKFNKYGKGEALDPIKSYQYCKKYILDNKYETKVFIHSQSYNHKKKLIDIYNPNKFLIERQKNFFWKTVFNKKIIFKLIKCFIKFKNFSKNFEDYKKSFKRCENLLSRWYSTKKVVDLKKKYEIENNVIFDLVMLTRLDMAYFSKFEFDKISKKNLTVPHHNDVPAPRNNYKTKIEKNNKTYEKGISDFWFISSSENIDRFSKLYDYFGNYNISSHISSLQHAKFLNLNLNFYKFRGIDHEAIRRLNHSSE